MAHHNDHELAPPEYWAQACTTLTASDATIAHLIQKHPEVLHGSGSAFRTLLNAIVGQQISVAAASGIWRRFTAAYPTLEPSLVAEAGVEELRGIGLSKRKIEYITAAAAQFASGHVDPREWPGLTDDEIREALTRLRGIGPWTADMVLIFHERRPDVLPLGDVGLVNAAARLFGWETLPGPDRCERLAERAERWRPYRTVATWYIWRELDADPVIY